MDVRKIRDGRDGVSLVYNASPRPALVAFLKKMTSTAKEKQMTNTQIGHREVLGVWGHGIPTHHVERHKTKAVSNKEQGTRRWAQAGTTAFVECYFVQVALGEVCTVAESGELDWRERTGKQRASKNIRRTEISGL